MLLVARKVKHGTTQHHIKTAVRTTCVSGWLPVLFCVICGWPPRRRPRHSLHRLDTKVLLRQMRCKLGSKLTHPRNLRNRLINSKHFVPTSQEIDKIPTRPTTGIKHPHSRNKPALQKLVKHVDVDPTKPLLEINRCLHK